ncbi:MAG: hypothetical protein OER74_00620 [Desulfobacteraceae bacterium]|nr:hypothetical protein [Desulfobacteraceae bacterium]
MNELCLFCNEPEKNYNPGSHIDYVCGLCVILLIDADQEDLKKSYQKALNEGYLTKASALELFVIPEEQHGRRPDKPVKRNINRERTFRSIRNQKRLSQPVEA